MTVISLSEINDHIITGTALLNDEDPEQIKNLEGALMVAPLGYLNWYFANIGAYYACEVMTAQQVNEIALPHAKSYLRNITADYHIYDLEFPEWDGDQPDTWIVHSTKDRDSDDSYAASFLMLIYKIKIKLLGSAYITAFDSWVQDNIITIKKIADYNLVNMIRENNLTSVYRRDLPIPKSIISAYATHEDRIAATGASYLMDNCEVFCGLNSLRLLLGLFSDSDEFVYEEVANTILLGIDGLFKQADNCSYPSTLHTSVSFDVDRFYPWSTCQAFPFLYTNTTNVMSDREISNLNFFLSNVKSFDLWGSVDEQDVYPWMILSYYIQRIVSLVSNVDYELLRRFVDKHIEAVETNFIGRRADVTINEMGCYWAIKSLRGEM